MKHGVIFISVLLLLLFSVSTPSVFALVEKKSINDLTRDSDNIITGKVLSKESYWENGYIFTNVTVSTDSRIKGNSDNKVTVKIPGGTVGEIYADVSDVPLFDDNEEVLLFLKGDSVVGWNQGKYSIRDNRIKETGGSLIEFVQNIEQNLRTGTNNENIDNGTYSNLTMLKSVTNVTLSSVPHITSVTPSSGPSIAAQLGSNVADQNSTQVTISGVAFGPTVGIVKFWRGGTIQYDATIVSWGDTKIVAKVPGRVSSGLDSSGDGNVQVFASDGTPSDDYGNFGVTYSYGGGKWHSSKVTYMVNPNTADTTGELPAIQAATNTWNNASANFEFVYGGPTSKTSISMDGENSVIWVNYDTGSVATTTTWWFGTDTKTIVESDIVFNGLNINWGTDGSPTKMDVQSVATHEFGHWLQLLDLYGSADSKKMMYGYISDGIIKRTLDTGDAAGIIWIYGPAIHSQVDNIPPTTNLSGATEGATYSGNVTIKLVAKDNIGGSGVANTAFMINDGHVAIYSTSFVVNSEGKNNVTYYSIDNAGNIEKPKEVNFTISNGDILAYYRGLGTNASLVETSDLLKASNDWRGNIIPNGFYAPLATSQLLTLANEWRIS